MLVWMDLEMTGLEPERHVIVEIATIITEDDLTIVSEVLIWLFTPRRRS